MPQARFRADVLRAARTAAGLTQNQLADRIGLSDRGRIYSWESGLDQPNPRYIPPLAKALKLKPAQLLVVGEDGPTLADLRTIAGLTLQEVSNQTGIPYSTVLRTERRGSISTENARLLAKALGTTITAVRQAAERLRPADQ